MNTRTRKIHSASEALDKFLDSPEALLELAIARLWRHWPEVLGPDMSQFVRPLGHRKTTMLLGASNSLVMQELSYFGPQILEKANSFLGNTYFQKVQMELMGGRPALDAPLLSPAPRRIAPPAPAPLGNLLPCMDPASPVNACYRAYVKHFNPEMMEK